MTIKLNIAKEFSPVLGGIGTMEKRAEKRSARIIYFLQSLVPLSILRISWKGMEVFLPHRRRLRACARELTRIGKLRLFRQPCPC